ncbi:amidohydrolase family protein [Pseudoxanthomonas sp. CF125]|uniref:N-acyl-D-amino-acid deacylase family protein n=1 Tax=Pseudoxanthomonas sp. CF125 TaxID=1855303 RepID=UPI00088E52FF|nr:amidohydrolase family protein [Pseudoxanthomonas sp. CF125]SDQ55989.1 N-acyl-D-amino-acid deacylase [Pseudoxanthomonas sp. CF125]
MYRLSLSLLALALAGCASASGARAGSEPYDLLIRNGVVYDGSGAAGRRVDVAVRGDRIAALLPAGGDAVATHTVDAHGQAVAPGFINMLSWAPESLIADGRGVSDTKQGVTLEVFGEGWSMGPYNEKMKADALKQQGDIRYPIEWTTLGEYLEYLEKRGVTPNVASFVGATTVRIHELGEGDVKPDAAQLARMQDLVRQAMAEGALGVGGSLIYPPAAFADSSELIALAQAVAESGGGYVAHMRSEADRFLEALDETIGIARATGQRAEVYHLKAAGERNWSKMAQAIANIESARKQGALVSANMYTYTAGATGLTAGLPPWVQADGHEAMIARLKDPAIRKRVIAEMKDPNVEWENIRLLSGSDDRVLLFDFKNEKLKPLIGKTLAEVARERGKSGEETLIDLVVEDDSRVVAAYFLMSEENVELGLKQPWTSLGSDAESSAPEGVFLKSSTHPRAYGNFAKFLGHYVRDRKLMSLEEGIHRLTGLPATNWKLRDRGCLNPGCFADVVVFDPARIADHATYKSPQQYATGVSDVFVNGVQVLRDGEHTGAKPGRVVRGPGWQAPKSD